MSEIIVQYNVEGIKDLCIIKPKVYYDQRGYLYESYNLKMFKKRGLDVSFVQDNEAFSKEGTLRGFGINVKNPQAKLVRVMSGEIFDVVIDLRPESNTFLKYYSIVLSSENKKQLYIPRGFAHAYLALKDSVVLFKVTTHYVSGDEVNFAWNSPIFDIEWPIGDRELILSDTDKSSPEFRRSMVI